MSEVLLPHQTMYRPTRTGRFGVAYVRAIAATAGVGFDETSADEDVLGVDGSLVLNNMAVRIQVKATAHPEFNRAGESRVDVKPWHWSKWSQSLQPVYAVLVVLDDCDDDSLWMDNSIDDLTSLPVAAYWSRLNGPGGQRGGPSIVFSRSRRFTVGTVEEIHREIVGGYGS